MKRIIKGYYTKELNKFVIQDGYLYENGGKLDIIVKSHPWMNVSVFHNDSFSINIL